jgi:hypothetical protein
MNWNRLGQSLRRAIDYVKSKLGVTAGAPRRRTISLPRESEPHRPGFPAAPRRAYARIPGK